MVILRFITFYLILNDLTTGNLVKHGSPNIIDTSLTQDLAMDFYFLGMNQNLKFEIWPLHIYGEKLKKYPNVFTFIILISTHDFPLFLCANLGLLSYEDVPVIKHSSSKRCQLRAKKNPGFSKT